jgi:hypothetical protein
MQSETEINTLNLFYESNGEWLSLPGWGQFFLKLGEITAASLSDAGSRRITGIAVPTRNFAAALVSAGIVSKRSALAINGPNSEEHFRLLWRLPIGTHVTLLCQDKGENIRCRGILNSFGVHEVDGSPRIGVQVHRRDAGGATHFVSARDSLRIELLSKQPRELPGRQAGRRIAPISAFARHFFNGRQADSIPLHSCLECVLVGRKSLLREEITDTRFAANSGDDRFEQGTLQDVLRLGEFMSEGKTFRSDVVSASGRSGVALADSGEPPIIVFDGSAGFLKFRDHWRNASWIVILDRTELGFEQAADLFNQEFLKARPNVTDQFGTLNIPAGVELLSYQEERG